MYKIAANLIVCLKHLHYAGIVHCDIKPANIVLAEDSTSDIRLIDFGMGSKYILESGDHIERKKEDSLKGTILYCSLRAMMGRRQSRRDDLESLSYVLSHLLEGDLPWTNKTDEKNAKKRIDYVRKKRTLINPSESLSSEEIRILFEYAYNLNFKQSPDYEYLLSLFIEDDELKYFVNQLDKVTQINKKIDWEQSETDVGSGFTLKSTADFTHDFVALGDEEDLINDDKDASDTIYISANDYEVYSEELLS